MTSPNDPGSDQVFYPSCVVDFRFLFDETLLPDAQGNMPLPQPQTGIVGTISAPRNPTARSTATQQGNPKFSYILNRVPRMASVELPAFRTAGKFSLEVDWREVPFDPRLIRAASVDIYAGSVSPTNFAAGMTRDDTAGRSSVLSTTDENGWPRDDLMLISGIVDNWSVQHSNESTVKISGRDQRGILLDSPINPVVASKLDLSRDVVQVIHDLLRNHPAKQYLYILYNPNDWPNGVVPPVAAPGDVTRVRLGASGDKAKTSGQQTGDQTSFWDLITQYCQPADALVWREDLTWGAISSVKVGDRLMGFSKESDTSKGRRFQKFEVATVEDVYTRMAPVVALHMESGRIVRCTADHRWFTGRSEPDYAFAPPKVGRPLFRVVDCPDAPFDPDADYVLGYVRGIIDGDGAVIDKVYEYAGKKSRTKHITVAMNDRSALARYEDFCRRIGLKPHTGTRRDSRSGYEQPYVRMHTQRAFDTLIHADEPDTDSYMRGWLAGIFDAEGCTSNGLDIGQDREVNADTYSNITSRLRRFGFELREDRERVQVLGGCQEILRFFSLVQPAAVFKFQKYLIGMKMMGSEDRVLRIEECGEEMVYSLRTSTSTYFGQGYASHNCFLVGAVPFFRGRFLVIRPVKSIFDRSKPSGQQVAGVGALSAKIAAASPGDTIITDTWDPIFDPNTRTDDDGVPLRSRKFILGRNVAQVSIERKYTGVKARVIQVVGYDTSSKTRGLTRVLTSEYPPQTSVAARTTTTGSSGDTSQTDILRIPVGGVKNQAQLDTIAVNLYEEIGRGEIGGSCETKFLASYKGDNSDPDIMRLRPGHDVEFAADARALSSLAPAASTELSVERASFAQAVQAIQRLMRSTDDTIARALVTAMRSTTIGLLQRFRTANVKFDWSADAGMRISFDFQNYYTPRADEPASTGPNLSPSREAISREPRVGPRGQVHSTQPNRPKK